MRAVDRGDRPERLPRPSGYAVAWLILFALLGLAACSERVPPLPRLADDAVVLAFGDSLTHGTGTTVDLAYPAQLQAIIGRRVINAGVPGETTAGGLARLPMVLEETDPDLILLCLGGNDMLRQRPEKETIANLRAMLRIARERGIPVVLIGVPAPRLFSGAPDFYAELAAEYGLPYEGEIFNRVLKDPSLKSDTIHANAKGYRKVAERLAELLRKAGAV